MSHQLSLALLPLRFRNATILPIATTAILFWLFSYALFTSRVQLRGDEVVTIFAARRLLTTAAGALLFAAVLRFLIFPAGRSPAHPLLLVAAVVPAAAAMVAFRAAVDPLVSAEPLKLADHLRWVLVWSGYFGLWLIAFQAWRLHSERPRADRDAQATAGQSLAQSAVSSPGAPKHEPIEALASQIARLPAAERRKLIARFSQGYEESDDPVGTDTTHYVPTSR